MRIKPIILLTRAEVEFDEAYRWYAERNLKTAKRFYQTVHQRFREIAQHPTRHPYIKEPYRAYMLQHFPYRIIYRICEADIQIIAIAHTSREPFYWN